jgi:predicted nucleotidyltransferase component of viral defense system
LRRNYDFKALASYYGFSIKEIEKVCRISDLLESISAVKSLSDHLSLYGGTAFNFIYASEIQRLSVDLDFNYRLGNATDLREERKKIDNTLKDLLYRHGYIESNVKIKAKYPLTRFMVSYVNTLGLKDKFKVEMGYQKRIPILKNDVRAEFKHIGIQETFKTTTPCKEELFANKWCTFLYRQTPRDLFDVYQIANIEFNNESFRKCSIIESFTHEDPKLYEVDISAIERIPIDSSLRNLLQVERLAHYDFQTVKMRVMEFTRRHLSNLTSTERQAIDKFYDQSVFDPNMIDSGDVFNEQIGNHPEPLWTLKEIKRRTNEGTA